MMLQSRRVGDWTATLITSLESLRYLGGIQTARAQLETRTTIDKWRTVLVACHAVHRDECVGIAEDRHPTSENPGRASGSLYPGSAAIGGQRTRDSKKSRLVQADSELELVQDHVAQFRRVDHANPAGPADDPPQDLLQAIDLEGAGIPGTPYLSPARPRFGHGLRNSRPRMATVTFE